MTRKEFFDKWLQTFAPNVKKREYRKYYLHRYLWHVFSWELVDNPKNVLSGDAAREAYERECKDGAVCMDYEVYKAKSVRLLEEDEKNWKNIAGKDGDGWIAEFYVVSSDWKWTFVSTHENDFDGLGPYFYKID